MARLPFFLLTLGLILALQSPAHAATELAPIGSGSVRYLGLIKVYDATLYAPLQSSETAILGAEQSICLQLDYAVDVPSSAFIEAAETILARQHEPDVLTRVRPQIDVIHGSYRDVGDGDSYRLCYDDTSGRSRLALNDEILATVDSAEFAAIYFGIWLSPDQPLDESLRDDLFAGLKQEINK
ncbi:chalcone isomerase family protein [Desulfofustis glycolicus]|uniref:Chalcone isomerase-like n=1 Tax=Desulfofustis glycolicus DSM 9705 TaxID=1121409 RepID=A0A1M5RXL2_9BACT|nr:chalcone isomerase family protein [Desulfofustis glycolicus]MCB2216328.1 chalcone isomerase family protein [Desulfobulbaceae bacterium]SHH31107.1 Chalcone isomerase-like [Desulfofustis glycolicus DSM 9705]